MKVFIGILVSVATFAFVICNPREDQKKLIEKLVPIYENLTEPEIKTRIENNEKQTDSVMKDVTDLYDKTGLKSVAHFYRDMIKFSDDSVVKSLATIDKLEPEIKAIDYVILGIVVEVGLWSANVYKNNTETPIKVTDTEDVLTKKLQDIEDKLLDLLKTEVESLKKEKATAFWASYLEGVETFLTEELISFRADVKTLATTDIRAKNLQVMVNDLTDIYEKEKP